MNGLLQLAVLAVLAFGASALLGRHQRGAGASGVYVLVGVLIGPVGLGILDEDSQALLRPVLSLCVAWLTFLFGVRLRREATARLTVRSTLAGVLESGGTAAAVAAGLWAARSSLHLEMPLWGCVGVGLAAAASSRAPLHLLRDRLKAAGPTVTFLDSITGLDDLLPLVGLLGLIAWHAAAGFPASLDARLAVALPVGIGVAVGLVLPLAAGRRPSVDRGWVLLLGLLFLGVGVASQIAVPEAIVGLVAGLVVAGLSGGRLIVREIALTERPVTLLLAVLVGARLQIAWPVLSISALAVGLRLLTKISVGPALGVLGAGGSGAGLGLLGYGGLALAVAVQIDLSYGGPLSAIVLATAGLLCLSGDILGPLGLFALLKQRGEIAATAELNDG